MDKAPFGSLFPTRDTILGSDNSFPARSSSSESGSAPGHQTLFFGAPPIGDCQIIGVGRFGILGGGGGGGGGGKG